jgi:hypothetical protein
MTLYVPALERDRPITRTAFDCTNAAMANLSVGFISLLCEMNVLKMRSAIASFGLMLSSSASLSDRDPLTALTDVRTLSSTCDL